MTVDTPPVEDLRMDVAPNTRPPFGRFAIVTALAVAMALAGLHFVPRVYEAAAQLRVAVEDAEPAAIEALIATQIERAVATDMLSRVTARPEELTVAAAPVGSDVFAVRVRGPDDLAAATAANAIAQELQRNWQAGPAADEALQAQIGAQRQRLAEAEVALSEVQDGAGADHDLVAQRLEAEQRRDSAARRAGLIRTMLADGQPVEGVEDVRGSQVVQALLGNRAALRSELAEKLATLLPAHPTIRNLRAQIAQLDEQVAAEARRVADSLAAQAAAEDALLAALGGEAGAAQAEAARLAREVEVQRELLDSHLARAGGVAAARLLIDVPAAVPDAPVSPRTIPILAAVAVAVLAAQIGWFFLRGQARPRRAARIEWNDDALDDALVEPPAAPLSNDAAGASAPVAEETTPGERGLSRIVLLAAIARSRDAAEIADMVVEDALASGLSVCRVDAASGRPGEVPGLTDLCAGQAGFGDVVHPLRDGLAEVPWGTLVAVDRRSDRALTLVRALADLYEVVVVSTGRVGLNSTLPLFAGAEARLVLVHDGAAPAATMRATIADAQDLGFAMVDAIALSEPRPAVA